MGGSGSGDVGSRRTLAGASLRGRHRHDGRSTSDEQGPRHPRSTDHPCARPILDREPRIRPRRSEREQGCDEGDSSVRSPRHRGADARPKGAASDARRQADRCPRVARHHRPSRALPETESRAGTERLAEADRKSPRAAETPSRDEANPGVQEAASRRKAPAGGPKEGARPGERGRRLTPSHDRSQSSKYTFVGGRPRLGAISVSPTWTKPPCSTASCSTTSAAASGT